MLAAVLLGSMALAVPSAHAAGEPHYGCKKVHLGTADTNPNPRGKPPIAIGDSTMLLPLPDLNEAGFSVNGRGCRGTGESIALIEKLRERGRLPHLVVFAAYSNGGVKPRNIADALEAMGPDRVLGLVTEYDAQTGKAPAPDTGVLFKARKRYPKQVTVLDWVKHSRPHHSVEPTPGAWFLADLFHPNFTGAQEYANFLTKLLRYAPEGRRPR